MPPQQMDQFFDRGKVASSGSVHGGIVLWKESFVNKLLVFCNKKANISCNNLNALVFLCIKSNQHEKGLNSCKLIKYIYCKFQIQGEMVVVT